MAWLPSTIEANKAEPNGLFVTIGAQSQTDPDAVIRTRAKYDPTTFNYVGGLAAYSQGLFVNKDAVERLYNKSARPVVMGLVGSTLRSGNYQVLWGAAFLGWNVKWIRGYRTTAELRQALERGEIDMTTFGASTDIEYLLRTGKFAVVSQSGTVKGGKQVPRSILGGAPIISDLVKDKHQGSAGSKGLCLRGVRQPGGDVACFAFPDARQDCRHLCQRLPRPRSMIPNIGLNSQKIDPDSPVTSKADLGGTGTRTREGFTRDLGLYPG